MSAHDEPTADPVQRVCPQCGAPASWGSWCDSCGFELTSVEALPTRAEHEGASPDAQPKPAAEPRRAALIAAIAVLMVGIAAVVAALAGSGSP